MTNLFFILFAWFGYRALKRSGPLPFKQYGDIWTLVVAMVLIGLGSGLWHTWALPGWTVIVDVVPIYLFINVYIFALYRRLGGLGWLTIGIVWLAFTAINITVQSNLPPDFLGGSIMYGPTMGFMLISALVLAFKGKPEWKMFIFVTLLFATSLTFRTLDGPLCAIVPFGTHFMWHTLNAIVLYRLVLVLLPKKEVQAN